MTTILETLKLAVIMALCMVNVFGLSALVTWENTSTGSGIEYLL